MHYVVLYPQNGDRIATIDSVTSLHPMYTQALCLRCARCVRCVRCAFGWKPRLSPAYTPLYRPSSGIGIVLLDIEKGRRTKRLAVSLTLPLLQQKIMPPSATIFRDRSTRIWCVPAGRTSVANGHRSPLVNPPL